jgi:O-antigen/teichoic acid export membrane protein
VAGSVGSLLLLLIAWGLAGHSAGQTVAGLLACFALAPPALALATVPRAMLQAELRFRTLSLLNLGESLLRTAITVGLAALSWGAWSFPVAIAAASPAVALFAARAARFRLRRQPDWRLWPQLLPASGWMVAAGALFSLTTQVDYLLLGI